MTIGENLDTFAGLPVQDFDPERGIASPGETAYRLRIDYEGYEKGQRFPDLLAAFLSQPNIEQTTALVVGSWGGEWDTDSSEVVEALASSRDRLPDLKALFFGDITSEESEISWINQSDVAPLFEAFPLLEEFGVRGGNRLSLGRPQHDRLKKLVIEAGGLPGSVVREVAAARLPQLEHLELWLGDPGYGNDVTIDDLAPILSGEPFPRLKYLGLRDDAFADATAQAVAAAPVVERLEVLDLSLGTLGDEGAAALLNSPAVKKLTRLDLHHHFMSDEMLERFQNLGPEVDLDDQHEPEDYGDGESYRYVAVAE